MEIRDAAPELPIKSEFSLLDVLLLLLFLSPQAFWCLSDIRQLFGADALFLEVLSQQRQLLSLPITFLK